MRQPFPGIWVWRDPLGHYYLVDQTGSRKTTPSRAGPSRPTDPAHHDPDLEIQIWDAGLRPALEYAFEHTS